MKNMSPNMLMHCNTAPEHHYYENSEKAPAVKTKEIDKELAKKKRIQHCQRCENHGSKIRKSRHDCPYKDCTCTECSLTNKCQLFMKHQQRFWRWRKQIDSEATKNTKEKVPSGAQRCDRCRNHGIASLKKGHKGNCEFINCTCEMCTFITKRQEYLKHNQRLKRKRATMTHSQDQEEKKIKEENYIERDENSSISPSSISPSSISPAAAAPPLLSRSLSSMTLIDMELEDRKKQLQSVLLPTPVVLHKPMPTYPTCFIHPDFMPPGMPPYQYLWLRKF